MKKVILTPELPSEIKKNIKQPTLFEINTALNYVQSEDKRYTGIKGEEHARMVVFTNFILGRKPVLLKGSRSSGKTMIMATLSRFCPNPLNIAKSSEKADYHDFEHLNEATHFIIPEINKVNENIVEMLKDMGEGAPTTYKYTDYSRMPRDVVIDPKPFITSIADENRQQNRLGEELLSRLTVVNTDSSMQQNILVIEEKLKKAQNPYEEQVVTNSRIDEIIEYVKSIPSINLYTFIYLPGKSVINAIPPKFTDSRRDTDKYLDNTKGIALFHLNERMVVEINDKKNILVTPADAWYNHIIYNEILLQSALKAGPIERKILDIITAAKGELFSVGDIRNKILGQGLTPSHETIRKACDNLSEIGYLTRIEDQRPFKYMLTETITASFMGGIDWASIVEECKRAVQKQFPSHAQEYIKRYCTAPIIATHPFTGQQIDILAYKEQGKKVEPIKPISLDVPKPQPTKAKSIKEDPIEMLHEKIKDLLRKNSEMSFEELHREINIDVPCEEEELETRLGFLNSVKEVIYKQGKVRILE